MRTKARRASTSSASKPVSKVGNYVVSDVQRGAEPKKDRTIPLAITTDPVEALKAVRKALVFGVIEMTCEDGRTFTFTPRHHPEEIRRLPAFRRDEKGSGLYHGFIQFCEKHGYGSPVPKKRTVKA